MTDENVETETETAEPVEVAEDSAAGPVDETEDDANATAPAQGLGADLLDRMTGKLGTTSEILERGRLYQAALAPSLQEALQAATGLEIDVRAADIHTGRRRKLWATLNPGKAFCTAEIRNWSSELSFFCGTSIVVTLVECLLGGADPDAVEAVDRPLSAIELDMSMVVFEQLADALKHIIGTGQPEKIRAAIQSPELEIPVLEDDPFDDFHAAAIGFNLEFGAVSAPLYLVAPQARLIKTKPVRHAGLKAAEKKAHADWKERLGKRVSGSTIRLEARIAMDPMKLSEVGRLQPGDILPFSEETGSRVMLRGNGKDIYTCALGRSGQRYMVQIEGAAGTDDNWRKQFS